MELAAGAPMGDLEFKARRDIPAFKAFPFAAHWSGEPPPIPPDFKVAIIGSGFAGVVMAVQLDLLGVPYVVIERRSEAGGLEHQPLSRRAGRHQFDHLRVPLREDPPVDRALRTGG